MGKLVLNLLGQVDVRLAEKPVIGFCSGKAQALLFYLAVTGQTHTRPALAGLLWADLPDSDALTNLRQVLSNLRKLVGPYLSITRQTVTFKPDSDYWLDVAAFQAGMKSAQPPSRSNAQVTASPALSGNEAAAEQLRRTVDLYQGDFLAGFYVRDAPLFEEWQLTQRAHLRESALNALHKLTAHLAWQRDYETGLTYGRRLLALEPWHEPAHRQLMQLYAQTGQHAAALRQYDLCRQLLEEELGVVPTAETTALYEQIRDRKIGPANLPPFLTEEPEATKPERNVFVARERELADLTAALSTAHSGQGQILFVIGGAGRGKTVLVNEFARRVQVDDPALMVLTGYCNLHTGTGDPYLPFREALSLLLGEVEAKWSGGLISRAQARRLWAAMPLTISTLVEHAPGLIDTFVPGRPLQARAATFAPPAAAWFKRLTDIVSTSQPAPVEQKRIFTEYTALLTAVAAQRPLLLIIEDLQWVDPSSSDLLFHLSRQISDSPILIIGTYRPEEVALNRPAPGAKVGVRHPMAGLVSELKRRHGDIWLDLGALAAGESRHFVEAYLDTQPNRLSPAFREKLFQHTGGHALFTVEVVREMVDHHQLIRDEQGQWVESDTIDWQALPAKVEGVIERRINRLTETLQAALTIASVEGETFTAEVVARVQQLNERRLVQRLSQELDKQHRLVTAQALEWLGRQRLSGYRFRHQLFQHYLYRRLDETERAYLHEEVGNVLEALYRDQTERVAVQLARHFVEAGLTEKAVGYLRQAGERAMHLSANEEAIGHFNKGLALLNTLPDTPERARQEVLLRIPLGHALIATKGYGAPEVEQTFNQARVLCRQMGETPELFRVLWGLAIFYSVRAQHKLALEAREQMLQMAQKTEDRVLHVVAHWSVGITLYYYGELALAHTHLEQGVACYDPQQHHDLAYHYGHDPGASCLAFLAWDLWLLGYPAQALTRSHEALVRAREVSHPISLAYTTFFATWLHQHRRDWPAAQEQAEALLALSTEQGFDFYKALGTFSRGVVRVKQGQVAAGIAQMSQGLADFRALEAEMFAPEFLGYLAEAYGLSGQAGKGLCLLTEALASGEKTGERYWDAELYRLKGELLLQAAAKGAEADAENCFHQAIALACQQKARSLELRTVMSLCRLWQKQGKNEAACKRLTEIYGWFSEGFDTPDLQEAGALLKTLS